MNVPQALEALIENQEQLDPPAILCRQSPGESLAALMQAEHEEMQARTNQEWRELISEESDPMQAARLILEWISDKAQARERDEGYEEERHVPESQRMSR